MKKSPTVKFWYFIAIGAIILVLMMILASVIQLGDHLKRIHEYVSYAFYVIAFLLTYFLILRPVHIILFSPTFSIETTLENDPQKSYRVFKRVAKNLMEREDIPLALRDAIKNSYDDPELLRDAINTTYNKHIKKQMNKIIRKHAKTVLVSTAISQNGRVDFITIIVVNIKMIKELVLICGFRPSYKNLAKLVINVTTTALIAEGLENINLTDVLPQSGMGLMSEIPIIKGAINSTVDGIANALLTLRIGVVTRKYLFDDAEGLTKEKIRLGALIEASKHLPIVIADALFILPKGIVNFFKGKDNVEKIEKVDEL